MIVTKQENWWKTIALLKSLEQVTGYNFVDRIPSSCVNWAINWHKGVGGVQLSAFSSVSQPPGRGPVPGPGFNYTGPREVFLEFVILVF